ncbi:hypothetical protein HDE_09880 [Halotydeus destructor]|nr:hypothetical protein HDE_09880 [Halotydeus destructor]
MANDDPIFLAIKWSLLIINVISAVFIAVIFLEYLFQRNTNQGLSLVFVFNCIIGFLVAWLGAYAAWKQDYNLLIIYGVILIINLVLASFGGDMVYKANLGLYVVSIILAFLLAYFIRRGGSGITSAA